MTKKPGAPRSKKDQRGYVHVGLLLSTDAHRRLRVEAAIRGVSMGAALGDILNEVLPPLPSRGRRQR